MPIKDLIEQLQIILDASGDIDCWVTKRDTHEDYIENPFIPHRTGRTRGNLCPLPGRLQAACSASVGRLVSVCPAPRPVTQKAQKPSFWALPLVWCITKDWKKTCRELEYYNEGDEIVLL
jgi:hypothetical protein